MQSYFMAYCLEFLPQPFSNWKFNWRRQDLNPGPTEYQSNVLPTELSWLDKIWWITALEYLKVRPQLVATMKVKIIQGVPKSVDPMLWNELGLKNINF